MFKQTHFLAISLMCTFLVGTSTCLDHFLFQKPNPENTTVESLINHSAKIVCNFKASAVYVYFENTTSIGYGGTILKKLSECGTAYMVLRNQFKTQPLKAIDDGVIMYLVMMVKNASQQFDLSIVNKKSAAKHRSYFILIVHDSTDINRNWLVTTFKKFWDIWVLNVVIFFWQQNSIQMFTYSPFTSRRFVWKINSNAESRNDLFFHTTPDMNGQELKICLFPEETRAIFMPDGKILGTDGFMSSFVASRLNATRVIVPPHRSSTLETLLYEGNHTVNLCLSETRTAKVDMALNTRFLAYDNFQNAVEHTVVYNRDDLCVLVPKAHLASFVWNLFRPFKNLVWAVTIFVFFVSYGFCRILLPHTGHVLLKLYSTMLTQPLNETDPKVSLKVFLMFWFIFCFLITGAYKCNLMSNLVFRLSLPEIDNLEDLAKSPYKLVIHDRHQKFIDKYINLSASYGKELKKKILPSTDDFLLGRLNANDLNYAILEKFHVINFRVNSRKHYNRGRPLYHIMDVCPIPFHTVYIVPYGSPYLGFLNTLVRRAQEHGFVDHWAKLVETQFKNSGKSVVRNNHDEDDLVVLKLSHLQAAFYILIFGLSLATMVLFVEIYQAYRGGFQKTK